MHEIVLSYVIPSKYITPVVHNTCMYKGFLVTQNQLANSMYIHKYKDDVTELSTRMHTNDMFHIPHNTK